MTSCDKDQLDELLKKGQAVTATLNRIDDINQMDGLIKKGQTDAAKLSQEYCRTELDELLKQCQTIILKLSHDGPKVRLDEVLNQSRELIEQLTQNDHMVHPVSAKKSARKSTYKDLEANKSKTKPTVQQGFRQQDHARLLPMALPVSICQCGEKKYSVGKGRSITVINMKGRYDLSIPRLYCERCQENWVPGLREVQDTGYWLGTINFSTLYDFEVFLSFEDLKMAAPGLSRLAFIRMLDMKTAHYGRCAVQNTINYSCLHLNIITATSGDNDVPVEPLMNTIEEMAVSIKQRRHHLYRHTDECLHVN
ncbi:hypothetical protein E1301_Tti022939 [Triplophysa tibetana]|uniref:CxC3 like cysteine cluster domain-containing protein n=1 Tax=Triplophysa tibetana TaxID=1572043 RepID=A0A5A9MVE9_9TELE|nr:hypothetical protein E1301_Tti022939 [Triplophysa tibetana]